MKKQEVKALISWSSQFSSLPWRQQRSLYHTLVSEIMLQQTTVSTVLPRFVAFILQFPTIEVLAQATEEQVMIAWKGLGYYRRARNLRRACQFIATSFEAKIPLDIDQLLNIPGIGEYTAHAITAIGANAPYLCVDANLERVLSRYYAIDAIKGNPLKKEIHQEIEKKELKKELAQRGGRLINEALMDLGREICKPRKPLCDQCPLRKNCKAFSQQSLESYPKLSITQQKKKSEKALKILLLRVLISQNGGLWVEAREKGTWLEGHLELPTFILSTNDPKLTQYPHIPKELIPLIPHDLPQFKSIITKYKIDNIVYQITPSQWKKWLKALSENKNKYHIAEEDCWKKFSTASNKALKKVNFYASK